MSALFELARQGERTLAGHGIENAAFEAKQLLFAACGIDGTAFLLRRSENVPGETEQQYLSLLERRCGGVPLQYLLGRQPFLDMDIAVGPGVLIPRPETEELAQYCISLIGARRYRNVFDLCAGSGCIGLSIALHCSVAQVWLLEKYDDALFYLRKNVPPQIADRVHILQGDLFTYDPDGLPRPDLIVSNPPYIPTAELPQLQREVLREPQTALDGGETGLDFYRALRARWFPRLVLGGGAAVECDASQTQALSRLFADLGAVSVLQDLYGNDRIVTLTRNLTEELE